MRVTNLSNSIDQAGDYSLHEMFDISVQTAPIGYVVMHKNTKPICDVSTKETGKKIMHLLNKNEPVSRSIQSSSERIFVIEFTSTNGHFKVATVYELSNNIFIFKEFVVLDYSNRIVMTPLDLSQAKSDAEKLDLKLEAERPRFKMKM